jgi:cysteine desulfurase / selenocysteine lyase
MGITQVDTQSLRSSFRREMPVTRNFVYLDHAAVSPLPAKSAQKIQSFAEQATQEGSYRWLEWSAGVARTRSHAARLIGCEESEIALVSNTTHGINVVAEGFPWRSGDNLVVPENEFPSNLLPWRNLERLGVELRLAPVGPKGTLSKEAIASRIDRRTRLISLSWTGFSSGYRCNLQEMVDLAHSNECYIFVDAIQGLGAFALDVGSIPIDFLAADGHKWMLGPEGAGLLYVRREHLELLHPLNLGWNSLSSAGFEPSSVELKTTAARYEGGSFNMAGMLGFGSSLELLLEYGCNQAGGVWERAILENVAELEQLLQNAEFQVELPEQPEHRSGILGVRWSAADRGGDAVYMQARKFLLERRIVTSVRGGRMRISTHAFNNSDDHRQLVDALTDFRERSG